MTCDDGVMVRFLRTAEAAAYLGVSRSWLEKLRLRGGGPVFVKLGRRVVYDVSDLDAWAEAGKEREDGGH